MGLVDNTRVSTPETTPRRNTRQRTSIQDVIEQAGRPLLPQEILETAQQSIPELGIATVYRNIKLLLEAHEIQAVELPGEPPRYESHHREHHHHFQCETCQRVYDIPGCVGNMASLAPPGFAVQRHELTLYGVCADCAGAGARSSGKGRPGR